jgi:hypothetical protein
LSFPWIASCTKKAFLKAAIGLAAVVTMENVKRFGSISSISRKIGYRKNHWQAEHQEALSHHARCVWPGE